MKLKLLCIALLLTMQHLSAQTWRTKKNYPNPYGGPQAVNFVLNNEIYVLGGYFSTGFWKYTPATDSWQNMGDLPFTLTHDYTSGSAFVINGKGYICAGEDGPNALSDTWEYNPATKKWTKKSPYPGKGYIALICFTVNDKAYLGGGGSGLDKEQDFYEYDATQDKWTKKADCPEKGLYGVGFVFSLNNKGYVSLNLNDFSAIKNDTYEYDPITDKWTAKSPFPGAKRYAGVSYVYNGKAYCGLGGGITTNAKFKDMYTYDANSDTWQKVNDFAGAERYYGTAAVVNNMVYVGLGAVNNSYPWTLTNDWWEYSLFPAEINTLESNNTIKTYPVPATNKIHVSLSDEWNNKEIVYELYNSVGAVVKSGVLDKAQCIEMADCTSGMYILNISANNKADKTIVYKQ